MSDDFTDNSHEFHEQEPYTILRKATVRMKNRRVKVYVTKEDTLCIVVDKLFKEPGKRGKIYKQTLHVTKEVAVAIRYVLDKELNLSDVVKFQAVHTPVKQRTK